MPDASYPSRLQYSASRIPFVRYMASALSIDLGRLTRELGIDQQAIARTVELLDEGNTVPFITRYRRDQTGGLDEEQISAVRASVAKLRQLEERKQTILKSIESQH